MGDGSKGWQVFIIKSGLLRPQRGPRVPHELGSIGSGFTACAAYGVSPHTTVSGFGKVWIDVGSSSPEQATLSPALMLDNL